MRIRRSYPVAMLVTFFIGLAAAYSIRLASDYVTHLLGVDILPPQQLVDEPVESRNVYAAILTQAFIRHRYASVVIDTTSADAGLAETNFESGERLTINQLFASQSPGSSLKLETIVDYVHKNEHQNELFLEGLGITYHLISHQEVAQLFAANGGGWQTFSQRYPNSLGLVSFSRVGFNSTYDQAFVYVSTSCGLLCGYGDYILLERDDNVWTVRQLRNIWVS